MTESVTEPVFSKGSGRSCKHNNFTKNGSDGVCAKGSFQQSFRALLEV